jgi:hypothetical protein
LNQADAQKGRVERLDQRFGDLAQSLRQDSIIKEHFSKNKSKASILIKQQKGKAPQVLGLSMP